ncbi:MAG TPA: hypothetical protein VFP54_09970 [Acidimicrobiales bacterium]|nr:hypothetical protein [Acidimicrobiales bacterium]
MLKFCGFDLELTVEAVLQRDAQQPAVFSATDPAGDHWLIVEAGGDAHAFSWICAPASGRAVEQVATGRATPLDALRHSLTGWVEVVRVVDGHAVPEQRMACAELTVLPAVGRPEVLCAN